MTTVPHGPGVLWLAHRAGVAPEYLVRRPAALADALASAARDAVGLAARLMSDDDATRASAEVEARAVRAHFAASAARSPGERFAATVALALREAAARASERGTDGRVRPAHDRNTQV